MFGARAAPTGVPLKYVVDASITKANTIAALMVAVLKPWLRLFMATLSDGTRLAFVPNELGFESGLERGILLCGCVAKRPELRPD